MLTSLFPANFFTNKALVTSTGASLGPPASRGKEKIQGNLWDSCSMGWSAEQREHSQGPLSTEPRWPHASAAAPTQHDRPISSWVGKAMGTAQAMPGSWGCWHRAHTGPEQQRGGWNPTSRCGQGFTSRLRGEGLLQPLSSPWASEGPWWVHGHPFLWLCLSSFCRRLSLG